MSNLPFMKCGHRAQGTNGQNKPVCIICVGINPGAETPADSLPDLTGRLAFCVYCGAQRDSSTNLPFWEYGRWQRGTRHMNQDSYYCGCRGWD